METLNEIESNESYLDHFIQDGVIVFKNMFDAEKIQIIANEVAQLRKIVMAKLSTMNRPIKTYSDIAERELGRLDYRCGFTAEIFNQLAAPVLKIVKTLSPSVNFRYYWGAIPSLGGAGPTNMHRDIYSLVNTTKGDNLDPLDVNLPPYYFTVLIPLVDITRENGPTQFIKGSHKRLVVDESKEELYVPLLSPGDMIIFDGRTLHKGSANKTKQERVVAYITFIANWYHDQTFVINEYLFPELAMKGR